MATAAPARHARARKAGGTRSAGGSGAVRTDARAADSAKPGVVTHPCIRAGVETRAHDVVMRIAPKGARRRKVRAKVVNGWPGSTRRCHTVGAWSGFERGAVGGTA